MKLSLCSVLFLVLALVLLHAPAFAEDFSADMVSRSPQGSMTAKMYVSGNKSRIESAGTITITRLDKKVAWILMPNEKVYMEQPLDPRSAASMQEKVDGEVERKEEGKETVNGMMTTKYRVTVASQGRRESMFQWVDEDMNFPVKTAAIDGSWSTEFKNIRRASQDLRLFEVPPGYSKMSFGGAPDIGALMGEAENRR